MDRREYRKARRAYLVGLWRGLKEWFLDFGWVPVVMFGGTAWIVVCVGCSNDAANGQPDIPGWALLVLWLLPVPALLLWAKTAIRHGAMRHYERQERDG